MKILVGNYNISLNKAELIAQIQNIETDVERVYSSQSVDEWITTGKDLELAKSEGVKFVEDLTEKTLEQLFQNICKLTAKKLLPKNRRFVVKNLNITIDYDTENSYFYTNLVIEFVDNEFDIELKLTSKNFQRE